MADLRTVEKAFIKAHKAGDKANAAILAKEVRRLRALQNTSTTPSIPKAPSVAEKPAPQEQGWGEYAASLPADMLRGAIRGINVGAASLPGLPGSIGQGLNAISDWQGLPHSPIAEGLSKLPSSSDTVQAWEDFSGELPKTQTTPGRYVANIGEFVGSGPAKGSMLRKAATYIVPGIASEAAGDLTKGQTFNGYSIEPWAKAAASLISPGTIGRNLVRVAEKEAAESAPSLTKVAAEEQAFWDSANLKNKFVNPKLVMGELNKFTPAASFPQTGPAADIAQSLRKEFLLPRNGRPPLNFSSDHLKGYREQASKLAADYSPSTTPAHREAAVKLVKAIDSSMDKGLAKYPGTYDNMIAARASSKRRIRGEQLDDMIEKADYYNDVEGKERALLRTELAKRSKSKTYLDDLEKSSKKNVVQPHWVKNSLSKLGIRPTLVSSAGAISAIPLYLQSPALGLAAAGATGVNLAGNIIGNAAHRRRMEIAKKVALATPAARAQALKNMPKTVWDNYVGRGSSLWNALQEGTGR